MAATVGVPSPGVLLEAAQREIAALEALLAATAPGQSVHGARRRIKQLRSLLRLLGPSLGEEASVAANAGLRAAADALAGHRRAEALIVAADRLEASQPGAGRFWCGIAAAHAAAHAAEGNPQEALATAQAAIAGVRSVLRMTRPGEVSGASVAAAFLANYRKARRLLRKGLEGGDPATLHEARKYVIHHLHQLKLLTPDKERRGAALERLREVLGDLNDLDELEQLASGVAIPGQNARLMRKARSRLRRRAERAADRLFRLKPAALAKRMGHAAGPRSRRNRLALQAGA